MESVAVDTKVHENFVDSGSVDNISDELAHNHDNIDDHDHYHEDDKNCQKCHKASFKFRKDIFCGKCVEEGFLEMNKLGTKPIHCRKCKKPRFRAKNSDFCEVKCPKVIKNDDVETKVTTVEELIEETTTEPKEYHLGPLGSLLKYLVVQNTWGTAQSLPLPEVEQ